jgi:hypothetical protein
VAGVGENITSWLVELHLSHFQFFAALFAPGRKHRHERHYGAAAVSGAGELRDRPDLVRCHPGDVCGTGQISPPIRINLFVIQSIWDGELSDVVMGTIPFHIIMFVLLGLLTAFPGAGVVAARPDELMAAGVSDRPPAYSPAPTGAH